MRRPTVFQLTARELQILEAVANGYTNAAIGRDLHIAEDSVKTHLQRIRYKLGARDRTHAVAIAYERGLLRRGTVQRPRS